MDPNDEHDQLRASIRRFVDREISTELVQQMDDDDTVPEWVVGRLAELGYLGLPFPEEYGGGGGGVPELLILVEELTAASAALSGVVGTTILFGGLNLLHSGSDEQRASLLPGLCRGEVRCAMAITEPDAGSDVAAVATSALRDGDVWRLNGSKVFISGAYESTHVLVVTRTSRESRRHDGLTVIVVPRETPGFAVRKLRKLGTRGVSVCELTFDDVEVPMGNVLGGPDAVGAGWQQVMRTFELERIVISAQSLGTARAALREAIAYAKERHQFGRPIGAFQAVAHLIADMATEVEACRAFIGAVTERYLRGEPCAKEAAMLKLFVTERTKDICLRGMQILGGYGYMLETPMQRHLRDSLLGPVGAGTSQIQRNIIAKQLGL